MLFQKLMLSTPIKSNDEKRLISVVSSLVLYSLPEAICSKLLLWQLTQEFCKCRIDIVKLKRSCKYKVDIHHTNCDFINFMNGVTSWLRRAYCTSWYIFIQSNSVLLSYGLLYFFCSNRLALLKVNYFPVLPRQNQHYLSSLQNVLQKQE